MSYIIKGILNRQLPWGLVLLGVMIAVVLEMSGVPSLAFAVGVYLPLSSSSPIFIGGMMRWLGDRYVRKKHAGASSTEEQLTAEGDKSPGRAAGLGLHRGRRDRRHPHRVHGRRHGRLHRSASRPGRRATIRSSPDPSADLLSLIPFALLVGLLYLVAREAVLRPKVRHP